MIALLPLAFGALFVTAATAAEPPQAMEFARKAFEQARNGQLDEAVKSLGEAIRIAPANPLYRSALGGIYERQGQLAEAVAVFGEAVKLDPANAQFRTRLEALSLDRGAALARERRYRAGLAFAKETAARFPNSVPVHIMLGLFFMRNQQNLAAVDAYRRAFTLDPASAEASVGLGIAQTSAGLDREAQATFEAGLKLFSNDAIHRQAFGVLLAKQAETGDTAAAARAQALLESALALDPKLAEAHYQLGNLALARGETAAALVHFEAASQAGLDDSRIHYATARALRRSGRASDADARLELFRRRKAEEEEARAALR